MAIGDGLNYLREFEHITLARLLLAQARIEGAAGSLGEALDLLERLRRPAEEGGRMGSVIEILVLQSLAYQLQGDRPAALSHLERALTLAEPEGYVRIFVDEGAGLAQLIEEAAGQGIRPSYTRRLLSSFAGAQEGPAGETIQPASRASSPLVEPLSQRELEILRLFKSELSGPEIAQELIIALSTVRTHTKSIYSKLNVNSRRGAVNRAVELGLILSQYRRAPHPALDPFIEHAPSEFVIRNPLSPHQSPHVGKTSPLVHLYSVCNRTQTGSYAGCHRH